MTESKTPAKVSTEALSGVTGGFGSWQNWGGGGGTEENLGGWDDAKTGTGGNDTIHANGGNDQISGAGGDDKITGNAGNDGIDGGAGADELHGDNYGEQWSGGNDGLDGGAGDRAADRAFAGGGDDSYTWRPGDGNDEFHGQGGNDTLVLKGVSLDQLKGGLSWNEQHLMPKDFGGGYWGFVNGSGQVQPISGTFSQNGESVTFYGTEYIALR